MATYPDKTEQVSILQDVIDEMRLFLLRHESDWPIIYRERPDIAPYTLTAFVRKWKGAENPTLKTLLLLEQACRLLDPGFLTPDEQLND